MALSVVVVLIREADNLFQVASVFLIVTQLEEFQEDAFYNSSVKLNVQLQQVNNRSVDLDLEDFFRLFALRLYLNLRVKSVALECPKSFELLPGSWTH